MTVLWDYVSNFDFLIDLLYYYYCFVVVIYSYFNDSYLLFNRQLLVNDFLNHCFHYSDFLFLYQEIIIMNATHFIYFVVFQYCLFLIVQPKENQDFLLQ